MKTKIIFVLPLIVLLFSCAKERTIKVSAINPATGEGHANLRITIFASKTGPEGEELTQVYEGYLDDQGEVYATFDVKKGRYYVIKCQVVPDITTCYINNLTYNYDIHDPNNKEFVFEIAPCGKIKVNIHNVNCEGPNDTLILERNYQHGTDNVYLPVTIVGCYSQPGVAVSVPMGNYEIKWTVIRSGISQTFTDMLFVPKEGEGIGEYTINY